MDSGTWQLPVIDITALIHGDEGMIDVAAQISRACRDYGFFYVSGHAIDEGLQQRLESVSRQFFSQDLETKLEIGMSLAGRAWRGYFPVGGELTSGRPDRKEGIYFGAELPDDHPLVEAGVPLHGRNLFPRKIALFRETVLDYMDALTKLGHRLMAGIALSLDLEEKYFADRYTADPLILFRIFNYPPFQDLRVAEDLWSVGEHTDYGILTILKQDDTGGLQIKTK
ncbi:MAG: isopenicillin N synthase family oxygenase, partial [Blastocatellia bacterium]|nr:isopenicillin N synthase family oxygenase [Blastocatellia bacterium]